ncbi:MAG: hypothetical protein AB8G22_02945, partial [Saprospiraceae bacterium]
MKVRTLLLFCYLFVVAPLFAQLNTTLISQLDYDEVLSDVWGYVAPDGTEYALVGINNGVSVVHLSGPANPGENACLRGVRST